MASLGCLGIDHGSLGVSPSACSEVSITYEYVRMPALVNMSHRDVDQHVYEHISYGTSQDHVYGHVSYGILVMARPKTMSTNILVMAY